MNNLRPTILAIDDTPTNSLALGVALESRFELQIATSGEEGLVLAKQMPPDLILLDVMMPGMDGYEVCKRLKADPRLRNIPVIFVTAMTETEAESTGLALGAADYLTKPLNVDIAGQRIHNLLEREQLRKEVEAHRNHLEEQVERRTAELMKSEARAAHILQSSADGLYGVDATGRITFINPEACRILGYEPESAIGQDAHALFHHSHEDGSPYPVTDCPSHQALAREQEVRIDTEVYWHADGRPIPVTYALHPMTLGEGNRGAIIGFVDMSARRAASFAREQALLAAENLVRVRNEFLSNMSHELRTPLNGILGFAEIGLRCHDPEKAHNAFEKILISGKRLLGQISDILDFSKIETGKINLTISDVILSQVIEDAVELVRERARARHLNLIVELAPNLPNPCQCDALRLGQVLFNLLTNAIKFTEHGSVTLSANHEDGQLVFRVSDTGIGITHEAIGHLFLPFGQLDGSRTRRYGGSGLGLVISKRIVELMGGDIHVESLPGAGSTFEVRIPHLAPG